MILKNKNIIKVKKIPHNKNKLFINHELKLVLLWWYISHITHTNSSLFRLIYFILFFKNISLIYFFLYFNLPPRTLLNTISHKLDWEILSHQVSILENNNNVHFKLNFEIFSRKSWASKQSWENHVHRNTLASANITICNLNVLNFSSCVVEREKNEKDQN